MSRRPAGLLRDDFRSCLTLKIGREYITGHIGCLLPPQFAVAHHDRDRNLWVLNGRVADKPCVRCVRLAFAQGTRFTTYADVTQFLWPFRKCVGRYPAVQFDS